MIFIGIDPGITGAVAVIDGENIIFYDTPTILTKNGKTTRTEFMPSEMADILSEQKKCHVFIEKVGAMPGQGVTSMFSFGKGYGVWIGIIAALKIPHTFITPQSWKKHLMQGMKDKDAARIRAQQLYPCASKELSRKKDIGRADALLIAEYGRLILST